MKIVNEVDARYINPHPEKPKSLFRAFDSLALNESFIFILDHDPFHLTNIMNVIFPGQYSWNYLEKGPDLYRVEVGRVAEGSTRMDIEEVIRRMFVSGSGDDDEPDTNIEA
jgi:uncharacterized protein (DUF2249 family)